LENIHLQPELISGWFDHIFVRAGKKGAPLLGPKFSGPKEKPMSRFHTGNRETLRRSDKAMIWGCFFGWCGSVVKAIFSNG